jgi:peptide/nickel transport system substrate-binding protein
MSLVGRICCVFGLMFTAVFPAIAQDVPRHGGVLSYGLSEPDSMDCHATLASGALGRILPHYSTLLKLDRENYPAITGDLAESWDVSADGLTYTFRLRSNVLFHDGTPLTSSDVKATYDRLRNPTGGAISARQSYFVDIASIETPDDRTIIFKLKQPNAAMLVIFATPHNCIYSAARLAEDPRYPEKHVMGTGPFKFVSYKQGGDWISERFDKYFVAGKPYLDGLVIHTIARTAKVTAIGGGQVLLDFEGMNPEQRDSAIALRQGLSRSFVLPSTGALTLAFNTKRKPFDDVRVRRALTLAIDRWTGSKVLERQMEFAQIGGFQRVGSPFGLSLAELETKPGFSHDIDASRAEARRLLAEAGQTNLKFTYLNRPQSVPLGVFLIDQWRRIGVTVEHQVPEPPTYTRRRQTGDFDVTTGGLADVVDDPTIQLTMVPSRSKSEANLAQYEDPKMDELYEKQARATNLEDRKKAYRELEDYMFEQSYYAMTFWGTRIIIMANEIQGYTPTPSQGVNLRFEDVWLKN